MFEARIVNEKIDCKQMRTAVKAGNRIYVYFVTGLLSSYCIEKRSWSIEAIMPNVFPINEKPNTMYYMFVVRDIIFIFNNFSFKVLIYCITDKRTEIIMLREEQDNCIEKAFASVVEDEYNFYIISHIERDLLKISKFDLSIKKMGEWVGVFDKALKCNMLDYKFIRLNSVCLLSGKLYGIIACKKEDVLFSIDVQTLNQIQIFRWGGDGILWGMNPAKGGFWIQNCVENNHRFILWDPAGNQIHETIELGELGKGRVRYIYGKYICPIDWSFGGKSVNGSDNGDFYYIGNIENDAVVMINRNKGVVEICYPSEKGKEEFKLPKGWAINDIINIV